MAIRRRAVWLLAVAALSWPIAATPPASVSAAPPATPAAAPKAATPAAAPKAATPAAAPAAATRPDAASVPATTAASGAVVLVGLAGLRADDLSPTATPELWRRLHAGASGSLSVRAVRRVTCPADGWLTLNTGAPTTMPEPHDCAFPTVVPTGDGGARVGNVDAILAGNARFGFEAAFGTLATAATAAGCATAIGPGAAVALAGDTGRVDRYVPDLADTDPTTVSRCPLTVVDLGTLPDNGTRGEAVRRADGAMRRLPAGATVLVAGLADTGPEPRLHLAIANGPTFGPGRLDSPATRQPGIVRLTDLTPTVLHTLGTAPPPGLTGSVMTAVPDTGPPAERLRGQAVAAEVQREAFVPFFTGFTLVLLVLVALVPWAWSRPRAAAGVAALATGLAAVPGATYAVNLVPWWTFRHPLVALAALVAGIVAAAAALARLAARRVGAWGPPAAVALATVLLLGVDAVAGSKLQLFALYGHSPLVAGRFYGFGNPTYAIFAVAALLLAAAVVDPAVRRGARGRATVTVVVVGVLAVVADGWPTWGADFGGMLALVPAFALLALRVAGARPTALRLTLAGVGAVATVAVVATLDWLRPAGSRSHLGGFVAQVLDGNAGAVVRRKATASLHSFTDNYLSLLVPLAVGLIVVLLVRPHWLRADRLATAYARLPTLRPGLAAAMVAAVLGFAVNDSGATVPAMAFTIGVPLAVATVLRSAERQPPHGERPGHVDVLDAPV